MEDYFPESIPITEAIELQTTLAEKITLDDQISADPKKIGGVAIYSRGNSVSVGLSLLDAITKKVLDKKVIHKRVNFSSLPGCEGFREGKVVYEAITDFETPDVFIINGHGINHPRRLGIASHVGLAIATPTIGASLQLICGKIHDEEVGRYIYNENGEKVGKAVKKELGAPSVFVSPGNKITIDSAAKIVEKLLISNIPEPIKIAQDELVSQLKGKFGQI